MNHILQQDFDMSENEARFFVYVLINQDNTPNIDKKEVNEWYLNPSEKYTGQIFKTHYSINFTNNKKNLCLMGFHFFSYFFFSRGFTIIELGIELICIICTKIHYIKDEDYCVFSRIIELNIGNKGKLFGFHEINTANKDGYCDYQEELQRKNSYRIL